MSRRPTDPQRILERRRREITNRSRWRDVPSCRARRVRIACLAYGFLLLASVGCREGPTGPDPTLVVVEGSTATHEGVDLQFQRFNLSWYPADESPHPSDGDVFATLLIEEIGRASCRERG